MSCSIRETKRLVMAGFAGYAGTGILAEEHRDALKRRLPGWMVDEAAAFREDAGRYEAAIRRIAGEETENMLWAGDGGILAALWFFGEQFECGMDVQLRAVPIRQETVEISEIAGVNPYQLYGRGAALIGTDRPDELLEAFYAEGIMASQIGHLRPGSVRRLFNDTAEGYLNIPRRIPLMREGTVQALLRLDW